MSAATDVEALKLFPLGKADEVVQAASATYKAAAAALVARADELLAERRTAEAGALESEWKAAKAAKDWLGAKAAKAKFDESKVLAEQQAAEAGALLSRKLALFAGSAVHNAAKFEGEWKTAQATCRNAQDWEGTKAAAAKYDEATAAAEAAAQILSDAKALVASAPLKLLPGLADVYSREADRRGDADDYDAAHAYAEAAEVRVPDVIPALQCHLIALLCPPGWPRRREAMRPRCRTEPLEPLELG